MLVDLPTLILSDEEEEPSDPHTTAELAAGETEIEGAKNIEVVAKSSSSSSSSSLSSDKLSGGHRSTKTEEESSPPMPHHGGKGLMSHGGLIDAKAIKAKAFKISSFEPSSGKVNDVKKIFSTFVLPELEISLARKPAVEHIDASNVAIEKVFVYILLCFFIYYHPALFPWLFVLIPACYRRLCLSRALSARRQRISRPAQEMQRRKGICFRSRQRRPKPKNGSSRDE